MRSGFLFLPFLALLVGVVGTSVGNAMPDVSWITPAAWAVAAAIFALWVSLDFAGFAKFFKRKGARYGASSGLTVLLGILVIFGVGMLSIKPRFNKSYDASRSGVNTLADQSIKVATDLKESGAEITVEAFFQDPMTKQQFQDLITLYQRTADIFKISYVDPQADPTRAMSRNITTETVVFLLGERESKITDFSEEKITNALVNLLKQTSKSIYFISGHGEYSIEGTQEPDSMGLLAEELRTLKYESATLALDTVTEIPHDADALIIAGPQYDFKENEIALIDNYLKRGGALLAMADAVTDLPNLNSLLKKYGIQLNNDIVILNENDPRAALIGRNIAIWSEFDQFSAVSRDFASRKVRLMIPNTRTVSALNENEYQLKAEVVGSTAEAMQQISGVKSSSDLQNINASRVKSGSVGVLAVAAGKVTTQTLAETDKKASVEDAKKDVDAGKLDEESTKEIRVVVAGSSQFANNVGAQRAENRDLFINIANFLMQDESLISIRPKDIAKGSIDVSSTGSQIGLAFLLFVYPFIFLGSGLLYWLIRRRA